MRPTLVHPSQLAVPACSFVFSGLPGTGKTTLARALARNLSADYVRVDTIEGALVSDGDESLVALGAGYRVADAIAGDKQIFCGAI